MGTPTRTIILGATSAIAEAYARRRAAAGDELVLVGRSRDALDRQAIDLGVRGAKAIHVLVDDLADTTRHPALLEALASAVQPPDVVLLSWGTLTDQSRAAEEIDYAIAELQGNFTAPAALLLRLARWLEPERRGVIAVITSVAGDRGRQSNFVYGSAKGGLQRFLEGLRHRLYALGIAVIDIRPGFVATPMTQHLNPKGPLWTSPDRVARDIDRAVGRRRAVLYTPWFWRWIMLAVTNVPRPLMHRTKL